MALTRLKSALLAATLSAAALGAPGAAHAQFYFDTFGGRFSVPLDEPYERDFDRRDYRDAGVISRAEVIRILNRRGYRVDPSIARNADVYVADAVDPSGRRLRVIVDAFDGAILRRIEISAPPRAVTRFEEDDWRDGGDYAPAPPRVIPGVGPAQRRAAPSPAPQVGQQPAPRKPATARVEPRAPAPRAIPSPQPATPAQPPATAPAPAAPGPAAALPTAPSPAPAVSAPPADAAPASPPPAARPAPETRAEAPVAAPPPAPARAGSEPAPAAAAGPRVIPLYKTAPAGAAAPEKPAEGAP